MTHRLVPPDGPIPAKIMIVGEAPGADEEIKMRPFVGASGYELDRMLHEARITRAECFVTNVVRIRPPKNDISAFIPLKKKDITSAHVQLRDRMVLPIVREGFEMLKQEILNVKPNIIIPVGNVPLWALTGRWGIKKWRGSMLTTDWADPVKVLPTYHPAAVLRQWDWRAVVVNDFKRAARFRDGRPYPKPEWKFIIRPDFKEVCDTLEYLFERLHYGSSRVRLSFDLETRSGHIACAGLSWSLTDAICIPFMVRQQREGYWSSEEEAYIVYCLMIILTHENVDVVGQNILYDAQYTYRHWHFVPKVVQDCMISQHTIFSDMPKSLAFQASMYCNFYVFWKEEGKNI